VPRGPDEIARTVLRRTNEVGDSGLRARREVLRRVVEWEDYSTCWGDKALEAQGLVAKVRHMVNAKDAFTRMRQERDRERDERSKPQRDAIVAARLKRTQRLTLHQELISLFGMTDRRERGLKFERLLNRILGLDGLSVRESFTLTTDSGHVGEQIDGLVELGTQPYLVEAKWWSEPLGVDGVSRHPVRVYGRDSVHGLMVSASGFAEPAIAECRTALSKKVFVLAELREIVLLLERDGNFGEWLKSKTYAASVDRRPLYFPE